jgi:outer membrane protein assembly factor BamB
MQSSGICINRRGLAMSTDIKAGTIRTVAGNGDSGLAGDGGPATVACLNEPKAVTVDGQGNLIVADSENHLVRKVDWETGLISTVAGFIGTPEPRLEVVKPPAVLKTENDDPFSDTGTTGERAFAQQTDLSGTVRYVVNGAGVDKRFGGDGGRADRALLNFPTAVAVDKAGHLYIADTMNHCVRLVEAGTGLITTIAGVGQPRHGGDGGPAVAAGLNDPAALAVSESGMLYIADQSNNRVRAIDLTTGLMRTVAGTGSASYNGDGIPATEADLAGPSGLALGKDGTLFIADTFNGRIRAIDPVTGLIRTVVGDGGEYRYQGAVESPSGSVSRPAGIALDAEGNLFMTDSDNHLVRRWDRSTGRLDRLAGVGIANYGGDGGSALEASLSYPFGIVVGSDGNLFIADTFNHRIREIVL